MMLLLKICISIASLAALFDDCFCKGSSTYTTKYDNVNLEEVLSSDRLLSNYIKCLLSEGPCTTDGAELKRNLPDAIGNDCNKCTERQKQGSTLVMHHIIDNRPKEWSNLEKIYDPEGTYRKSYLKSKGLDSAEKNECTVTTTDEEITSNN